MNHEDDLMKELRAEIQELSERKQALELGTATAESELVELNAEIEEIKSQIKGLSEVPKDSTSD
jgi:predicted  nucleic acid-binding Zn-ribbon protein